MKLKWHKWTHWEYWPSYIIYLPSFFMWLWWSVKFGRINFYKYLNPSIKNGGLWGDGKMEVYNMLPEGTFPRTLLVSQMASYMVIDKRKLYQLNFPLVIKPNVGLRGKGVSIVNSDEVLLHYSLSAEKEFLIQEFSPFQKELGIFYYRMPNEKTGKISGITIKEFLTVTGDGCSTLHELLSNDPRYKMQIPKLKRITNLMEILPKNESRCVVPFGNHNRGTKFLDGKHLITPELESLINDVMSGLKEFYYGRLDLRYNSIEELIHERKFCIIEINGAKSEPTHIYDPKHSFWYGQKEIIRHQLILKEIIAQNLEKSIISKS
ncbi:MAG: D-alanine--D-alanine ligase [Flavobacteriales bacterium]